MYSLSAYGRMIGQPTRFERYRRAIERWVKPGDLVADLGAGPGVFALLAAQAGAAQVFAVEPDPVVGLVDELAVANGLADRITVVEKLSTEWFPKQPMDVIVSDLRGVLPTFTHHLPSIADARRRLLRPGGRLIPAEDEIWAAPVTAPQIYDHHLGGFSDLEGGSQQQGLDLRAARERVSHEWCRAELDAEACVAEPARLGSFDYAGSDLDGELHGDLQRDVDAKVEFCVERTALMHGVAVWFDSLLAPGLRRATAPAGESLIYGQALFPLAEPLAVETGDVLSIRFRARHDHDDYIYRWQGEWRRRDSELGRFDQSTFYGAPLSRQRVDSYRPDFRPALDDEARHRAIVEAFVLKRLAIGTASLGELAADLATAFPADVADAHSALRRVSAVVDRFR